MPDDKKVTANETISADQNSFLIQNNNSIKFLDMKDFMMIFRGDKDQSIPSPEQMQQVMKLWQDWIGGIAAQGKFVATNALGYEGRTINSEGVE
jgi:hypothetical protein